MNMQETKRFLEIALNEAEKASKKSEVPVGAVLSLNGKIISKAHNLIECKSDATAHAEIIALRKAAKKLKNWRLNGTVLY
ncbi:MAG: nucleoside deaminase, partial [Elusimicrobiota bacterium]